MSTPEPKIIRLKIANVLLDNGGLTETETLRNTVWERMFEEKIVSSKSDAEIARAIYRELGFMVDHKDVVKEPVDSYGQTKYRLNDHGRIEYFGTKQEKMKEYWGNNGLTIALALGNLVITLVVGILTIIFS